MNRLVLAAASIAFVQGCASAIDSTVAPQENAQIGKAASGCVADRQEDAALVGQTEQQATVLLSGCVWRIGERDGEKFAMTMDYLETRRTLGIAGGKVIWVRRG